MRHMAAGIRLEVLHKHIRHIVTQRGVGEAASVVAPHGIAVVVARADERCGSSIPNIMHMNVAPPVIIKDSDRQPASIQTPSERADLDIALVFGQAALLIPIQQDRKSTRLNSSHVAISYA